MSSTEKCLDEQHCDFSEHNPCILREKSVFKKTGVGRTTRLKWEKEGIFPKRIKIGKGNHHGWILEEINEWIEKKRKDRDG